MINKLKYLFLLAVCAGVFGSAANVSAQSTSQTYANKIIQYYEWLFETQFTSAERSQYQAIKAEDFQTDPVAIKKGSDELINNFATIKSKDQNEQERVRGRILSTFVNDLRGMKDDKEAVLLVSVYDEAQARAAQDAESAGTGDISLGNL